MSQVVDTIKVRIKSSSTGLLSYSVKLVSGLILGLTVALVGQEIFNFGSFSFALVIAVVTGLFLKKVKHWSLAGVFVLDLIFVLVGLLLKLYIQVAPGA